MNSELQRQLSTMEIMGVLPHRFPFLLVDQVVDRGPNSSGQMEITAIKAVTINEPFFPGHFPHQPIMPGVLIIEALAQTCGLCAYKPHPNGGKWNFYILGIDGARFRKPVVPGVTLTLKGTLLKQKSSFLTFGCKAYIGDELVCEAEILAQMVA